MKSIPQLFDISAVGPLMLCEDALFFCGYYGTIVTKGLLFSVLLGTAAYLQQATVSVDVCPIVHIVNRYLSVVVSVCGGLLVAVLLNCWIVLVSAEF